MRNYGRLCTIIYDLDKPYAEKDELELYLNEIEDPCKPILEPMCGSGRFLIPMLEKGYNISGFDLSEDMLDACRMKCEELKLIPDIFRADITTFKSSVKYDYVIIPIGSVSLLINREEQENSFKNIYRSMNAGGKFVFSFLNTLVCEQEVSDWRESMRYEYNGMDIICRMKQKVDAGLVDMKLLYELRKGDELIEEEYQDFPMKLFGDDDISGLLEETGFSSIRRLNHDDEENVFSVFSCIKHRQ